MTHKHVINSSADLEMLVKGDELSRVRMAGEYLLVKLNAYEMNRKDLAHLLLLSDLVADLSVDVVTVTTQALEAEFTAVIANFLNLRSLTLWWDDYLNLGHLISPVQSKPASRFLTSVCFHHIKITAERAKNIAKAFEHNQTLKSFEAGNLKRGESDLVPILRANHTIESLSLGLYNLTNTEFFVLCRFFVECKKREKLQRLSICIEPKCRQFNRTYLKFGALIAEKNVAQDLSLVRMPGPADNTELISYAQNVAGFKL